MEHCTVKTPYGSYIGKVSPMGVYSWLGVPYAKPPVGPRRWHAPEPLDESEQTFGALEFGPSQMQHVDEYELASARPMSEDCLTLNIWTRNAGLKGKPVMVYIHGGGYYSGGSSDPLYNGEMLAARNDVVVVSINYRINLFGFMNFGAIDPEFKESGYLGTMDQVAALTWVHENIALFGGDPDNVTLFGESAGSGSSSLLMVTPAAKGLFHKVIAESGPIQLYNTPENSARYAREFMEMCGCSTMAQMMALTTAEIMPHYYEFLEKNYYEVELAFAPTADGSYIPRYPLQELKDGAGRDVKLMIGTTRNEYNYWGLYYENMAEEMPEFHEIMMGIHFDGRFRERANYYDSWQKRYMDMEPGSRYLEFMTQLDFRVGSELMAEYQSKFNDVYMYFFTYKSTTPPLENGFELGSCHAIEVPFVFHNLDTDDGLSFTGPNPPSHLADETQAAWVNFASTGDPSTVYTPKWQKYSEADRMIMEINDSSWTLHSDLNVDNLKELRSVYEDSLLSE